MSLGCSVCILEVGSLNARLQEDKFRHRTQTHVQKDAVSYEANLYRRTKNHTDSRAHVFMEGTNYFKSITNYIKLLAIEKQLKNAIVHGENTTHQQDKLPWGK